MLATHQSIINSGRKTPGGFCRCECTHLLRIASNLNWNPNTRSAPLAPLALLDCCQLAWADIIMQPWAWFRLVCEQLKQARTPALDWFWGEKMWKLDMWARWKESPVREFLSFVFITTTHWCLSCEHPKECVWKCDKHLGLIFIPGKGRNTHMLLLYRLFLHVSDSVIDLQPKKWNRSAINRDTKFPSERDDVLIK